MVDGDGAVLALLEPKFSELGGDEPAEGGRGEWLPTVCVRARQ
jgi:hypothetical protein